METQCLSYKRYAVIVASGAGKRMGLELPKQFLLLEDKPILLHTIEAVHNADKDCEIVLVLNKDYISYWQKIVEQYKIEIKHRVVCGGSERFYSVKNAIESIEDECEDAVLVAVHDGVRPFCKDVFLPCFKLAEEKGNAVCAVKSIDSVRLVENDCSKAIDRNFVYMVQTPQCFKLSSLKKAYQQEYKTAFTDDASVVESIGEKINICEGDRKNIKITTPLDMEIAKLCYER